MKWSEAKEKSADKTWAFLELRPTGKVVSKEQYEYVLYYAKQTGIDTRYIKTFEEEKGKYLRLGSWFGGASYYFYFADFPEGVPETAEKNEFGAYTKYTEYYEEFSYGKFGMIAFEHTTEKVKCQRCDGHGVIPIGKGIRGIMQCDVCGGSGKIDMPVVNKESNMKKAIIFDYCFEAPDELVDFCKNIGYSNPDFANDFDLMFDQRVVEFCEKRVEPLWSERVYKGKESYAFRCGFAGAGYIREIDTSKVWNLRHNNVDAPIINYVEVNTNKYGYLSVL